MYGAQRNSSMRHCPRAMSSTHCRCRYKKRNLHKKRNLYGRRDKSQDGTSARTSVPDKLDTKQLQKHVLPLHCSSVFYSPMYTYEFSFSLLVYSINEKVRCFFKIKHNLTLFVIGQVFFIYKLVIFWKILF